jgi:ornithine--oxo-acid transaminase
MLATGEPQARAKRLGTRMEQRLRPLVGAGVTAVRTRGLWAGIDIDPAVGTAREVCLRLMAAGVLAKDTHGQTVRLAPPIVIDEADLDHALDVFERVLSVAPASRV